ncbi:MoaD/ThiS family protein [Methanobrevibacter filiformis]|uniref:Sulfur carrier protein ThiS n=1 Tax=Methanobrevibacter filiformis TaxID=55758 RepID=A0A166D3K4_9EURY|nr:MoaD/ThiS family protein [Methanobrevibacter filiformis]KZX15165.1 sulfur carrier protein ThiS [Methanobrevibacter filiformis]
MAYTLKIEGKEEIKELNGKKTIKDLLNELELSNESIVTKKNGEVVVEDEIIEDNDTIQLIRIIYGG